MKFEEFKKKVWLVPPTMHGEELKYVTEAYETNCRRSTMIMENSRIVFTKSW